MSDDTWRARYERTLMNTFATPKAVLTHGEGCWVWSADGVRYLDFLAGIAVNTLGHAHPVLTGAISAQAGRAIHVSNYFATPPQLELAERLLKISEAGVDGRVFFANSGTEANEAAFKLARMNDDSGHRNRILALRDGFHGRTMGALALTGKPPLREPFEPMPPGVEHLESTVEALEAALDDTVAALFVEPIKGEAGVVDLPEGYLAAARELTAKHGALLILDEIQTGTGRTGRWFAYQHDGIRPDAVTLAKGLAGGVPIGALIAFGRAAELFGPGQHGTTFGGNPLATAAANAVLGEIEEAGLLANAARRGHQLREILRGFDSPLIGQLRGRGLLVGVGLTEPVAAQLTDAAFAEGLIVNAPNASTIRLAPPLIVGDGELREFRDRFGRALASVARDAGLATSR